MRPTPSERRAALDDILGDGVADEDAGRDGSPDEHATLQGPGIADQESRTRWKEWKLLRKPESEGAARIAISEAEYL